MVSMGPNSYSRLYSHMSDFHDIRSDTRSTKVNENSILDILNKTEEFSKFRELLRHSQYVEITLIVPINEAFPDDFFYELDKYQASMYVVSNTIFGDRIIPSELLELSPISKISTKFNSPNYMIVKNIDGITYINDCKVIIKDILAKNGIIHVIDKLNLPQYYI
jgi:uncharacterized surface protein with fasciclin (FAS1) repeats